MTQSASAPAQSDEPSQPVADYGLLADCNSAALVDRDGSIDWLCLPRYDSAAIFARMLDPDAGHWSIRPRGPLHGRAPLPARHARARDDLHHRRRGSVRLLDAMAFADGPARPRARATTPRTSCCGRSRASRARSSSSSSSRRGPSTGSIKPLFRARGRRRAHVRRPEPHRRVAPTSRSRSTDVDDARRASRSPRASSVGFALRWAPPSSASRPQPTPAGDVAERIEDTAEAWRSWEAEHDIYEGPHRELVRLSSRVLKGLTYRPTGAIVAAPTTSLPETVGGERNWDYRFSWIRDSSLTIEALYIGACSDEAEEFVSFMTSSAGGRAGEGSLQIMYGIGGEHDLSERELPHLRGWRDSRPVRVGNGAWDQTQLDVYGELLNSLYLYREQARRAAPGDPGASSPTSPTPPPGAGRRPTRACGRCAASRATTSPRRCSAGPRSTAPSSSRRSSASTRRPRSGRPSATRSATRCSSAAGARSSRRTPSRSTPTSSTPPSC